MMVYTAHPSSWSQDVVCCQFQAHCLYSRHPLNSRLCGLPIVLGCYVQEKNLVLLLGVKQKSSCLTTCSLITILTALPA